MWRLASFTFLKAIYIPTPSVVEINKYKIQEPVLNFETVLLLRRGRRTECFATF
jgi:hypothetical protein